MQWQVKNAEETQRLAEHLAELLEQGTVVTLEGDLGAGKTTFAQGLAKGLGVTDAVQSPTFTIIREYEGRVPFYHMDVYRLGEEAATESLGFDDYLYGDGVTAVEWAHLIEPLLPEDRLRIQIRSIGPNEREIDIEGTDATSQAVVEELNKRWPISH